MTERGGWKRRGFAVAVIALSFTVVAPELAAPVGAQPVRMEFTATRKPAPSAARRARILAAMRAAAAQKKRRAGALTARRAAARKALAKRNAAIFAARQAAAKKKSSSLSVPFLAFLAFLPFALMALYLLGSDYLRRREDRPRRKRGGSGLVVTRVSDR